MLKIIPHLWYDKEAKEAAEFYTSLFPNSKIDHITQITNTPSGDCDIVTFELCGQTFMAISAGPMFKFNPSISFHIKCKTKEEVDRYWNALSKGGQVLMELGKYPFSKHYGWVADKYGLSWQIILTEEEFAQKIVPALLYTEKSKGKASEAMKFYTSVFTAQDQNNKTEIKSMSPYEEKDGQPESMGMIKYGSFTLLGQEFVAMDSGIDHKFFFGEALSFIVACDTQNQIDYFWEKMSAEKDAEVCGWIKDKYGVSWQIWPNKAGELMEKGNKEQLDRVTQTFLKMKKFDIQKLQDAYDNK